MTLFLVLALVQSPDTSLLTRVQRALAASPIEKFDSVQGNTEVRAVLPLDLGGDSIPAIAAILRPAFRQTPTIIFFRRLGADSLERLTEGLAPGALIPVNEGQQDSHVLRVGVDFTPETHGGPYDTLAMIRTALHTGFNVVVYRTFIHVDQRHGQHFFVLMTDHTLPPDDSLTCQEFRFGEVLEAKYGHLPGGGGTNFLVVRTPGEVTIYTFLGVTPDGWIAKRSQRRRLQRDDQVLTSLTDGTIALTANGKSDPITAP